MPKYCYINAPKLLRNIEEKYFQLFNLNLNIFDPSRVNLLSYTFNFELAFEAKLNRSNAKFAFQRVAQ